MSGRCRFIARVVMVLGIIGTLWYVYTLIAGGYDGWLPLVALLVGGITTYVTYIIWAAITEVLEELEYLMEKMCHIEKILTDTYEEQKEKIDRYNGTSLLR